MGKPRDPDYWKKWRAAHPEYAERERQRSRKRRERGRGDRTSEYRARAARLRAAREAEAPPLLDTHPLIKEARRYVSRWVSQDRRDRVYRDDYDEAVSEVLLATSEGFQMHTGYMRWRRKRDPWQDNVWTGTRNPRPET